MSLRKLLEEHRSIAKKAGPSWRTRLQAPSPEVVEALLAVAEAAEKMTNPKNYRGDDYSFLMSKNVMGLQAALSHLEDVIGGAE